MISWHDRESGVLRVDGKFHMLTPLRARIVDCLMPPGTVMAASVIADRAYADNPDPPLYADLSIKVTIKRMRQEGIPIQSKRRYGYWLERSMPFRKGEWLDGQDGPVEILDLLDEPSVILWCPNRKERSAHRLSDPWLKTLKRRPK